MNDTTDPAKGSMNFDKEISLRLLDAAHAAQDALDTYLVAMDDPVLDAVFEASRAAQAALDAWRTKEDA